MTTDEPNDENVIHIHITPDLAKYLASKVDPDVFDAWNRNRIGGNLWAGYYSFYDAMHQIGVEGLEPIMGAMEVALSAGWWWATQQVAIVTERPKAIRRDNQLRLHGPDGPAIEFRDNWGVYCWNGTRVPKSLIEEEWTVDQILKENNAEIRRCAIEKMGWPTFVVKAGLKQVGKTADDPGNPGHQLALYDVPNKVFNDPVRMLICTNGTPEADGTYRQFGLTVPSTIKDPVSAAAWTFGLTKAEYLKVEVRR